MKNLKVKNLIVKSKLKSLFILAIASMFTLIAIIGSFSFIEDNDFISENKEIISSGNFYGSTMSGDTAGLPSFKIEKAEVDANNKSIVNVEISLSTTTLTNLKEATVFYRTLNATAIPGVHYTHVDSKTLVAPGGSTVIPIQLKTNNDEKYSFKSLDVASKYFYFEIYNVDNALMPSASDGKVKIEISPSVKNYSLEVDADNYLVTSYKNNAIDAPLSDHYISKGETGTSSAHTYQDQNTYDYYISRGGSLLVNYTGYLGKQNVDGLSFSSKDTLTISSQSGVISSAKFSRSDLWQKKNGCTYDIALNKFNMKGNHSDDFESASHTYKIIYNTKTGCNYYAVTNNNDKTFTFSTTRSNSTSEYYNYYTAKFNYSYYDCKAPEVIGYYTTNSTYTYREGSDFKIYLSVRFNEAVNIVGDIPNINADVGGYRKVFKYETGIGSDTLVYALSLTAKDVENKMVGTQIENISFDSDYVNISDFSYNQLTARANFMPNTSWVSSANNPKNFTSGKALELGVNVNCLTPNIKYQGRVQDGKEFNDLASKTFRSVTLKYELQDVAVGTTVKFVFNDTKDSFSVAELSNAVVDLAGKTATVTMSGLQGCKYLHVVVFNANGLSKSADVQRVLFDNSPPIVSYSIVKSGYVPEQEIIMMIEDKYIYDELNDVYVPSGLGDLTVYLSRLSETVLTSPFKYAIKDSQVFKSKVSEDEDLTYKELDDGIRIEFKEDIIKKNEENQVYGKVSYYSIFVSGETCRSAIDEGMFDSSGNQIMKNDFLVRDYMGKFYIGASLTDGIGNSESTVRTNSILIDTRLDIFGEKVKIEGSKYGEFIDADKILFDNAYYLTDDLKVTYFNQDIGSQIYIKDITYNKKSVNPVNFDYYHINESGDYASNQDETIYYPYNALIDDKNKVDGTFEEDGGTLNGKYCTFYLNDLRKILMSNGSAFSVPAGYYTIVLKVEGNKTQTQTFTFYLSGDSSDTTSNNSTLNLTENIKDIDTLKLINSVYWVTQNSYMYRMYNKETQVEGVGFTGKDGIAEEVRFVESGKPLVYASYEAALIDMIERERKDILVITNPSQSLVSQINGISERNADNVKFTTEHTIYMYKGLNYKFGEEYYYYSSNSSGAIVKALEQNAKKTIGNQTNNSMYNSFRSENMVGLGFDFEQIVDVNDYKIFNNTVFSSVYGDVPIASGIKLYNHISDTGVETQIFYRKLGVGIDSYYNLDIVNGQMLKDALKTTGYYQLVEMSANGISTRLVYIDCDTPVLQGYTYKGDSSASTEKESFTNYDDGMTFYLSRMDIKQIADMDDDTLLVIYEVKGFTKNLFGAYQAKELRTNTKIQLNEDGQYLIYVYDRSGNKLTLNINMKTTNINLLQKEMSSTGKYVISMDNRSVKDISSSKLIFGHEDMSSMTTDKDTGSFLTSITLNYSGNYTWIVSDRYGYTKTINFTYMKADPVGDFLVFDSVTQTWVSILNTQSMMYNEVTDSYLINVNTDIQFRYTNTNYKVEFINLNLANVKIGDIGGSIMDTTVTRYYQIPKEEVSWSLKLGYINDPYVYTSYLTKIDTAPPVINGVGFSNKTGSEGIDYISGSKVNVDRFVFSYYDDLTSIVRVKVEKDGDESNYYDMNEYGEQFEINSSGHYVITVYDILGNSASYEIIIDNSVDFGFTTGDKDYEVFSEKIFTSQDTIIKILEEVTLEFGDFTLNVYKDKIISTTFYSPKPNEVGLSMEEILKIRIVNNEISLILTKAELDDPKITYVEKNIIQTEDKFINVRIYKTGETELVFKAPKTLENNEWNNIKTYTYKFVIYDIIGGCDVNHEGYIWSSELGEKEVSTSFDSNFTVGGANIGYTLSDQNTLEVNVEISNNKFTTGFTTDSGEVLPDIHENEMGRYNQNFQLNLENLVRLQESGDLKAVYFRYNGEDYSSAGGEYYKIEDILTFDIEGEYDFLFVSKYGTEFTQTIRLMKSIGAITVATYADNSTRELTIVNNIGKKQQFAYSNKSISISLNVDPSNYSMQVEFTEDLTGETGLEIYDVKITTDETGMPNFILSTMGYYNILVTDAFGNQLTLTASINNSQDTEFNPHQILNGWNTEALSYDDYYTNGKLGFNQANKDIYLMSYEYYSFADYELKLKGATANTAKEIIVLNRFVGSVVDLTQTSYLGEDKTSGVYILNITDKYGFITTKEIRISCTADIFFGTRQSTSPDGYEQTEEDVLTTIGLYSNYSAIIRVSENSKYYMEIDGKLYEGTGAFEYDITFSDSSYEEHSAYVIDMFGNSYIFNIVIDRTTPNLNFVDDTIFQYVDGERVTTKTVELVSSKQNSEISYSIDGGAFYPYKEGDILTQDGSYLVKVEDYAGNQNTKLFKIDTKVSFRAQMSGVGSDTVVPKGIIVTSGTMKFVGVGDEITVTSCVYNGKEIEPNRYNEYSDNGEYMVTIKDMVGNEDTFHFYIYKTAIQEFNYTLPEGYTCSSIVMIVGEQEFDARNFVSYNSVGRMVIDCPENTNIRFFIEPQSLNQIEQGFEIFITTDTVNPTITMQNAVNGGETNKNVTFKNATKDCIMQIYKNGVLIKTFELGANQSPDIQISEEGAYKVVLTDVSGNVKSYYFTRIYTMNGSAIAIMLVLLLVSLVGVALFLSIRNRSKIK